MNAQLPARQVRRVLSRLVRSGGRRAKLPPVPRFPRRPSPRHARKRDVRPAGPSRSFRAGPPPALKQRWERRLRSFAAADWLPEGAAEPPSRDRLEAEAYEFAAVWGGWLRAGFDRDETDADPLPLEAVRFALPYLLRKARRALDRTRRWQTESAGLTGDEQRLRCRRVLYARWEVWAAYVGIETAVASALDRSFAAETFRPEHLAAGLDDLLDEAVGVLRDWDRLLAELTPAIDAHRDAVFVRALRSRLGRLHRGPAPAWLRPVGEVEGEGDEE